MARVGDGFARWVLPGIVLQSVLIGGGYATGREVVEFGARHGAAGTVSLVLVLLGFTLFSFATFEFARWARAYDYKTFMERLIGRAWPAFDVVFLAMLVLVLGVVASASGAILSETLGVPELVGTLAIVAAAGVVLSRGARVIERLKTVGSALLYAGYALFGVVVLAAVLPEALDVLGTGATTTGPWRAAGSGALYVGYNLVAYPAVLFTLHRQRDTRDSAVAGGVAGLLMTLPFALTYVALMGHYPDPSVLDAAVPWLPMLEAVGGSALVAVYGVVVGWTLLETSVGMVHAFTDRLAGDTTVVADGRDAHGGHRRPESRHVAIGVGLLLIAVALAQVGLIELIAKGYTAMAFAFLAVFGVPLVTIGMARVWRARRDQVVVLVEAVDDRS